MRCFVGLALPAAVRTLVAGVEASLRRASEGADVRWVAPDALHVTVRFLGQVESERLAGIADALSRETARHRLGELVVEGVGTFPPAARPHTVWIGVRDADGGLARLAAALDAVLAPLGFPPQDRPFRGHVTLGRVGRRRRTPGLREAVRAAAATAAGAFRPRVVTLFESVADPDGSRYHVRAEWPLAP